MSLNKPVLTTVGKPFDATSDYTFTFTVETDSSTIITGSQLQITSNGNTYTHDETSYRFTNTLPANTITNSVYSCTAKIRVTDGTNYSEWSDTISFYCYKKPSITWMSPFPETVSSLSQTFTASYDVSDTSTYQNQKIISYMFYLYDDDLNTLDSESVTVESSEQLTGTCSATFNSLINNKAYKIMCRLYISTNNLYYSIYSEIKSFTVSYAETGGLMLTNNCDEGYVEVELNANYIGYTSNPSTPTFIDDRYLDCSDISSYVEYNSNLTIPDAFNLRIWAKDILFDNKSYYEITFNPNGGSVSPTTVLTNALGNVVTPVPTYSGHKFLYWADNDNDYAKFGNETYSANTTLTAKWTPYFIGISSDGSLGAAYTFDYFSYNEHSRESATTFSQILHDDYLGVFLALNSTGTLYYSFDGFVWTTVESVPWTTTDNMIMAVSNGMIVLMNKAFDSSSGVVYYYCSTDLITWTTVRMTTSEELVNTITALYIDYSRSTATFNKFVFSTPQTSSYVMIIWTVDNSNVITIQTTGIRYTILNFKHVNNNIVSLGLNTTSEGIFYLYTIDNGTTWYWQRNDSSRYPSGSQVVDMVYYNNYYICITKANDVGYTSDLEDAWTFTTLVSGSTENILQHIIVANGTVYVTGDENGVWVSNDGINWTQDTSITVFSDHTMFLIE